MLLPWLGFASGCIAAKLCKRTPQDMIAIAIETGIQNTGVSIFILWFTLDQPAGDLTGNLTLMRLYEGLSINDVTQDKLL